MSGSQEICYSRGALSAEQLRREIDAFWAELNTNQELKDQVFQARLDLGQIDADIEHSDAITVRLDSSGADPNVLLIIAFAPAANRVLKDLWATVLLPRIRRRWGDDAVGDEVRHPER